MRRHLVTLTATTFVTWTGQRVTAVALPLVALDQTGDAWTTGLVGGAAGLPLVTSMWWGRRLRGHLRSGRALALLLVVQVVGLAIVPVAASTVGVGALVLCASGLVSGAAGALLAPAQRTLTADLADRIAVDASAHVAEGGAAPADGAGTAKPCDALSGEGAATAARALAWQDLAHRSSMVFAPPLGAWLLVVWGAVPLLWWQAVAVAVSATLVATVPAAHERACPRSTAARGAGQVRDAEHQGTAHRSAARGSDPTAVTAAVPVRRVVAADPDLAVGLGLAGIGGLLWFAFALGLALLGAEVGRPGELIAAGMAGYGVASVATSVLVPAIVARLRWLPTILLSWTVLGLTFLALAAVAPDLTAIALASAVGGVCMPLGIAALNGLISASTSGPERHAAFTAQTVLHTGGSSVGLLLGGAVIGALGARPTLVVAGVLQVVAPLVAVGWLRRTRGPSPARPVAGRVRRVSDGRRSRPSVPR